MNYANETLRVIQKQKAEVKKELFKSNVCFINRVLILNDFYSLSVEEQKVLNCLFKVVV